MASMKHGVATRVPRPTFNTYEYLCHASEWPCRPAGWRGHLARPRGRAWRYAEGVGPKAQRDGAHEDLDEEAALDEAAREEAADAVGSPGYRVSGDLHVRSIELEQDLARAQARVLDVERELFATRKVIRRRNAVRATSHAGLGAAMGAVLAAALLTEGAVITPAPLLGLVFLGLGLGFVAGYRFDPPDDDFPKAPPPRIHY
jgi:hypothetical protein